MAPKRGSKARRPANSGWGGRRPGSGRKPKGEKAGVPHRPRGALSPRHPLLVTARLAPGLPSLRRRAEFRAVTEAFQGAKERRGFRLVHFALLPDRMLLVVEGSGRPAFTAGMRGLSVRVAVALNKLWERRGPVFGDRYEELPLTTPMEVQQGLEAVYYAARRQGCPRLPRLDPDPYSSGMWFDGWRDYQQDPGFDAPIAQPRTKLLKAEWRRYGLLWVRPPRHLLREILHRPQPRRRR